MTIENDISKIKNPWVLNKLIAYAKKNLWIENLEFYFSKASNEQQYKTYIADNARKQVNIKAATKDKLVALARPFPAKYSAMGPALAEAREEIVGMIQSDSMPRFWQDNPLVEAVYETGLQGGKADEMLTLVAKYKAAGTNEPNQRLILKEMQKLAPMATLRKALTASGYKVPAAKNADEAAARIKAKLRASIDDFNNQVRDPITRDTKGGDTWKKVQAVANAIPMALTYSLEMIDSVDNAHNKATHLKSMKAQWDSLRMDAVNKYIQEHGRGGAKSKASGLKSVVASAADIKAETARVALAQLLVKKYASLDRQMDGINEKTL